MTRHAALAAAIPGYARGACLSVPGVWDGLTVQLVEQAGFAAAFLSGGALAMARHGRRDIGLVTLTELAQTVQIIREVSGLPLIVDADTGFGNADNAVRTARQLEMAGATAIQLEDQVFPKRCGFTSGKAVIAAADYIDKLNAVLDARRGNMLVIARTDARSVEGLASAVDRAAAYRDAGADLVFIEGPETADEMAAIAARFAADVPLVHNLVDGSNSPLTRAADLAALGFAIALHPLLLLGGFVRQAPGLLAGLRATGSTDSIGDAIVDLHAINALLSPASRGH